MKYERVTKRDSVPNMRAGKTVYNRLQELENGIEDGYIQILPCKVGDLYWTVEKYCNNNFFDRKSGDLEQIGPWDCEDCQIGPNETRNESCKACQLRVEEGEFGGLTQIVSLLGKIGKTYFLSKEEAENAKAKGKARW